MESVLVVVAVGLAALAILGPQVASRRGRAGALREAAHLLERAERVLRDERRGLDVREPLLAAAAALRRWSDAPGHPVEVRLPVRPVPDPERVVELEVLFRLPLLALAGKVFARGAQRSPTAADELGAEAERTASVCASLVAPRLDSLDRQVRDLASARRVLERDQRGLIESLRTATAERDFARRSADELRDRMTELQKTADACCGGGHCGAADPHPCPIYPDEAMEACSEAVTGVDGGGGEGCAEAAACHQVLVGAGAVVRIGKAVA